MYVQSKIQIDQDDYDFIKHSYEALNYKSFSDYVRDAVRTKAKLDRRRLRQMRRTKAMEMIGSTQYQDAFEPLQGEDFECR